MTNQFEDGWSLAGEREPRLTRGTLSAHVEDGDLVIGGHCPECGWVNVPVAALRRLLEAAETAELSPCPYCGARPERWLENGQTWIKCTSATCRADAGIGYSNPAVADVNPARASATWNTWLDRHPKQKQLLAERHRTETAPKRRE